MTMPEPSITIEVDLTNPGQFFACCGLLELADRLWPGAEAWFDDTNFCVACEGRLCILLRALADARLESSLTAEELKQLGTLLSKKKADLTAGEVEEKTRLRALWMNERLCVTTPFDLWLDWWRDARGERTAMKTWAAKQLVADMATRMHTLAREALDTFAGQEFDILFPVSDDSLPFNFDSDLCRSGAARDVGFSPDELKIRPRYRPLLELLAFIALQRFQPSTDGDSLKYCAWRYPLPPAVAAAVVGGAFTRGPTYVFSLFNRTKYMKAVLPSVINRSVPDV